MEAHWFGCVLSVLCLITISIVSSAHVSFNFTQADFDFDEASNDYSYDSTAIDSEESHVRRLCSRSQALYVEDRMNCNRFYACGEDSGQRRRLDPVAGMCPPGMWFDPNHSDSEVLCVFPEVLCATNHTDAYQYCNCSANYEANAVAQIEYDLARDPLIESSPICIVDNQLHLYASKRDCERYFVCYNERIFRMQCKPGMHFNAQRGYCDALEEANCEVGFLIFLS